MSVLHALRASLYSIMRRLHGRVLGSTAARHSLVGRPELWEMKRRFQMDFLREHGLKQEHRLVDIGCGTLRGGLPIVAYLKSNNYYGIEARANALRKAHKELDDAGLQHKAPTLIQSTNFSSIHMDQSMNYAWAFSVLIHFEDEVLEDCIKAVANWLAPDGVFLANVNIGSHSTMRWDSFPVVCRTFGFYEDYGRRYGLALRDLGALRGLGHISGIEQQDTQRMLEFRRS